MEIDPELSAQHWEKLANEEADRRTWDKHCVQSASQAREALYRRTAEAIRLRIKTGKPHCACCLKPM